MCIYSNGMAIESAVKFAVHFGALRIKKHAPSIRGKGLRACNRTDISLIMNEPISGSSTDIFSKRTKNCAVVNSKTSAPRQGAQKYEGQKILSFILFTLPWYLSSFNYWKKWQKRRLVSAIVRRQIINVWVRSSKNLLFLLYHKPKRPARTCFGVIW